MRSCVFHGAPAKGCDITNDKLGAWAEQPLNEAILAVNRADVVIMCMGLNGSIEGEEGDAYNGGMSGDKATLELPNSQKILFDEIIKVGKPVIFVNITGSCVNLSEQDEKCSAVIQCFYPGAEGGNALADIIFGKVSPSGRLPVTFYKSIDDLPPFEDYSMENRTYKFFKGKPVYPFGYGLTYSEIIEEWIDENTVTLTNNSEIDTLYTVLKFDYIPHKSLVGFKKIFVKTGEKTTCKFSASTLDDSIN